MDKYKHINFIKEKAVASSSDVGFENEQRTADTSLISGAEVKQFYDDLINTKSESFGSTHTIKYMEENIKGKKRKKGRSLPDTANVNHMQSISLYFKAAQHGDCATVLSCLEHGVDVDTVDEYKWTALMMSACSGHVDMVKLLLQHKANQSCRNQKGQSAYDIAVKSGRLSVIDLFTSASWIKSENDSECECALEELFCETCNITIQDKDKKDHDSSVVHLFNLKLHPSYPKYSISEQNKGFQLMLRKGWDKDKGLGVQCQGRQYPIKTTLKRSRLGLGLKDKDEVPRVTHFQGNDDKAVASSSVKHKLRLSTASKYQRRKDMQKDKEKAIQFRREFY